MCRSSRLSVRSLFPLSQCPSNIPPNTIGQDNSTGCQAYGYENMPAAALLASKQVKEAESRFRMYGISSGAMRTVEADFCEDPEVQAVLKRATVVLVNNEVFVFICFFLLCLCFAPCH